MTGPVIRIASYNIRKARGLDQRRLPERTLQVINQLDADIVVLQEADKRLGARPPAIPHDMIASETDFNLVDVSDNGHSLGWHGNAVLVRDGIRIDGVRRLSLPGLEPRGAVRIDVAMGDGLCLIATHLGLLRRDRQMQLKALCDASNPDKNTIIAGDFNEWSPQRGLDPLAERFEVHAPGRTFHARRPVAALDRFALSNGVELQDGGVAQNDLARIASDHLPIWSDITIHSSSRVP
jgi:endonuclease/exonuclease/phosphatase family metal-dependent hydrolase